MHYCCELGTSNVGQIELPITRHGWLHFRCACATRAAALTVVAMRLLSANFRVFVNPTEGAARKSSELAAPLHRHPMLFDPSRHASASQTKIAVPSASRPPSRVSSPPAPIPPCGGYRAAPLVRPVCARARFRGSLEFARLRRRCCAAPNLTARRRTCSAPLRAETRSFFK